MRRDVLGELRPVSAAAEDEVRAPSPHVPEAYHVHPRCRSNPAMVPDLTSSIQDRHLEPWIASHVARGPDHRANALPGEIEFIAIAGGDERSDVLGCRCRPGTALGVVQRGVDPL